MIFYGLHTQGMWSVPQSWRGEIPEEKQEKTPQNTD